MKVKGDLVDSSRISGLGSWRKVYGLGEVRARDKVREQCSGLGERVWLKERTEEHIVRDRSVFVYKGAYLHDETIV